MIAMQEYDQIRLSAELEGLRPTLLSEDEIREKLAALSIEPSSKLGKHALAGGSLFTRDGGHYRLDTAANLAHASVGRQCCNCHETIAAGDAVVRNEYGVALHRECDGLSMRDAQRVRAGGARPATPAAAKPQASTSLIDQAAAIFAGDGKPKTEAEDPPLLVAAADIFCGPRRTKGAA
jgi:hypothetical protein